MDDGKVRAKVGEGRGHEDTEGGLQWVSDCLRGEERRTSLGLAPSRLRCWMALSHAWGSVVEGLRAVTVIWRVLEERRGVGVAVPGAMGHRCIR